MKYHVTEFYHGQGMSEPYQKDYGIIDARNEEEAKLKALYAYNTFKEIRDSKEFILDCMSVRPITGS